MATVDSIGAPPAVVREPPPAPALPAQPPGNGAAAAIVADPLAAIPISPTPQMLKQAVASANDALRAMTQAVEFEYDTDAHVTIIKLVDTNDQKVLRQVPSVEMLQIAKALERMQATLVHTEA